PECKHLGNFRRGTSERNERNAGGSVRGKRTCRHVGDKFGKSITARFEDSASTQSGASAPSAVTHLLRRCAVASHAPFADHAAQLEFFRVVTRRVMLVHVFNRA